LYIVQTRATPGFESAVRKLAAICPLGRAADSLQGRFSSLLASARIYISPRLYSRFALSLFVYPAFVEALVLVLLPPIQAAFVLASLAILQLLPLLVPLVLSGSRRRSVEAELPFFLIALSIMSRDSPPSIDDGLRRVAVLGGNVFPALASESGTLERDLTFLPGSPADVLERAFRDNPSRSMRDFVHSFTTTLTTGKSVTEFVEEESLREVALMESRWKGFSESVGSLAEVSLMVLALFPVGVEMIAAAIPGFASSLMLVVSIGLLAAFSAVLLVLFESVQPVAHNATPSSSYILLTLASWVVCTLLFYERLVPVAVSLLVPLAFSTIGLLRTRGCYDRMRRGEQEISLLLHDLAEESKAGVSLPEALARITSGSHRFGSIGEPLSAFYRSIMLGATPAEAQRKISHPSWLVRLSFGLLSVAFATGAGFEQLERLSSFFRRIADARRNASRSLLPFVLVGVIVPVISVASMNFLGGLSAGGGVPFLPSFSVVSQSYVLISISAVAMLTGILLSKLFTQTSRHGVAIPLLMLSTLVSLLVFGVL
jgi:archaellum biogenesis protein FlaJ (TadC family)